MDTLGARVGRSGKADVDDVDVVEAWVAFVVEAQMDRHSPTWPQACAVRSLNQQFC